MNLPPGTRLGPYEIVALVGAGGMGEVYRARDTRLDRTVADQGPGRRRSPRDPQRRERFEREARAISSLNHPHICALYDVGEAPNPNARPAMAPSLLVLEYLEGADAGGPADRAVRCRSPRRLRHRDRHRRRARQGAPLGHRPSRSQAGERHADARHGVASCSTSASRRAPRRVAATACTRSCASTTAGDLTRDRGRSSARSQYMAPEQIEGPEADARTDIFAFGALLFEMLTGRPAFEGKTRASLLSAILKDEPPPVSRAQPIAPAALDRIVSTCLAKDPDDRYQSARDLLRDLRWVASGSSDGAGATTPWHRRRDRTASPGWSPRRRSSPLIATAAIALRRAGEARPAAGPMQFTIAPPENTSFGGPRRWRHWHGHTGGGVSRRPEHRVRRRRHNRYQIWLRPVATLEARRRFREPKAGPFPFWSPDSRFIGFFADGKLKKVQIAGGPPIVLCDAPSGRGGSWSRDNVILFAPARRRHRAAARVERRRASDRRHDP